MPFQQSTTDAVREALAAAREQAKDLRAKAEAASQVEKCWSDLLDYLNKDWPVHVLHHLERESRLLKSLRAEGHPLVPELEATYRIAKERSDEHMRRFPARFEEECKAAGLKLDPDSRHPRYTLANRFLQLEIDDARRIARLRDHEAKLAELPADAKAVIEVALRERSRLFDRSFDSRKFLKLLRSNYSYISKREKQADGTSIPIRQIARRITKNLKNYRLDEFVVDLARLIETGPLEVDGYQLDLQQTKDTEQGVLLPGLASRGYIGFIVFKKV